MEMHFRDLLISIKFPQFSFQNPVDLKWNEDGPVIGSAILRVEKNKIYADIIINEHVAYIDAYPHVAINVAHETIGYVYLSKNKGIDPEIRPLKDQLLEKKKK